jgi:hypothetical protein
LLPVPARYRDRVLTKLNWIEFWLLPSFLYRSGATPKGRAESWSIIGTLVPQIAPYVAYKFWCAKPVGGLRDGS